MLGVCFTQQDTTDVGLGTGHGRSPEASPSASAFKRVLYEDGGGGSLQEIQSHR